MPKNSINTTIVKPTIVATAVAATLLILPLLASCSRNDAPVAPVVTESDRATPVPVDVPDQPAPSVAKVDTSKTQRKIPVEDTLEPVPIDEASVPTSTTGAPGKRQTK